MKDKDGKMNDGGSDVKQKSCQGRMSTSVYRKYKVKLRKRKQRRGWQTD